MLQGDEPLVNPNDIKNINKEMRLSDNQIINLLSKFSNKQDFLNNNNIKAIVNLKKEILYMSREPIPFLKDKWIQKNRYQQTGIIAFTVEQLTKFENYHSSYLETFESIDMNRLLDNGVKIKGIISQSFLLGVDNKNDLMKAKKILSTDKIMHKYL